MAFKPSMRAHNKVQEIPLDIRPVMNLMVVLIPILLYSAEFVKLSIRELNLPPAAARNNQGDGGQSEVEDQKRFQLTVMLSGRGIYIGNKAGYLTGEADIQGEPAVPMTADGEFDYDGLQEKLLEIKDKIKDQGFIDEKNVIISAESDIEYEHIVKVMDKVTIYEGPDGTIKELFPQFHIGQVLNTF